MDAFNVPGLAPHWHIPKDVTIREYVVSRQLHNFGIVCVSHSYSWSVRWKKDKRTNGEKQVKVRHDRRRDKGN